MSAAKKKDKQVTFVNLDEALELVNGFYKRPVYSKRTFQNKVYRGEFKRYGPRHMVLLDKNEVLKKLCV